MLKLAVLSDSHLGFGAGTERENDAFNNFEQAIKLALKEELQPQLLLLCGDIFHDKIPRQEVLGKAIELFTKANKSLKTKPQVLKRVKDGQVTVVKDFIPPIVAIYGTHERRHAGSTNPVQILEKAGLLYCLHAESILVECGYDRIGIHGMSGVPEAYAKDTLKAWKPQPFTEGHNILMLHQNIKEVMPPVDYALEFADLPKDFITFCGHAHSTSKHEHPASKKPIVIVGSTVSTQLQKAEAEIPKGFYIVEFGRERCDIKFVSIKTRPFFYETLNIKNKKPTEIVFEVSQTIGKICKDQVFVEGEKPIVKIKLEGVLAEGFRPEDLNLNSVTEEFEQKLILAIDKTSLASADAEQHSKLLEEIREKKLSIDEIGIEILTKNLNLNVDMEKLGTIFSLLSDGELEQAESAIEGKFEPKPMPKVEYVTPQPPEHIPTVEAKPEIRVEEKIKVQQPQQKKVPDPETLQLAESGLSALGTGGRTSKPAHEKVFTTPTIKVKENTTPIVQVTPVPAKKKKFDDDIIVIKKDAFDLKKWLNKEY